MFQEKTVVITGAGRGIGRTLALGFAAQGATVLVHYAHSSGGAEEVVAQIKAQGGNAFLVQADLRKPEEVARLVKEARAVLGLIDVWINNAGASANSKETKGMSEIEIFERVGGAEMMGTWGGCRQAEQHIPEGGAVLTR